MKNKAIKFLATTLSLLVIIILFQNCAVSGMGVSPIMYSPKSSPNGLIFGSLTFPREKARFNGYHLLVVYKSGDTKAIRKNSTAIHFSPEQIIKMKHKGELDNGLTYLFAIERPEGAYEISSIGLFTNRGMIQKNENLSGFSIPFEVKKGEITYIGNINFNEYGGKNQWTVTHKNNFEKDLGAIKNLQKATNWNSAKNDTTVSISYKQ